VSLPVHEGDAQSVDDEAGWHLPKPSHPLVQFVAEAGHAAVGPAAAAAQVPCPLRLQAMHVAQDGVLQQTPSTQFPLPHWLPEVHDVPFGTPTHEPAEQILPVPQLVLSGTLPVNVQVDEPEEHEVWPF
jgi:hypothetical protein